MMDEFTAEQRARAFVQRVGPLSFPVSLDGYLDQANARVQEDSLAQGEAGYTMTPRNGRHTIVVNANESEKRRRFTICHEIGHIVLELESDHTGGTTSYARRPKNEICCDVFAAELLLPVALFRPALENLNLSVAALQTLSDSFAASFFATGSRAIAMSRDIAAFVVSQGGIVKYAFRSSPMRHAQVWVRLGIALPDTSLSHAIRSGNAPSGPLEQDADVWFEASNGSSVFEEAIHQIQRDQTLTLLWCDPDDPPERENLKDEIQREHDEGLEALDGILRWRGKK